MRQAIPFVILSAMSIVLAASTALRAAQASAPTPATLPAETPEQRDVRMNWWREARFGMFIHWGLYAIPAGEWNDTPTKGAGEWIMNDMKIPVADYEKLTHKFN